MSCKKISSKQLVCGIALSFLSLASVATNAKANDMMTKGADGAGMMSTTSMDMAPMIVSGTVLRYYSDAAGYVTAMDVQTADGVKFVRFSPSMGQRLYTNAPVGGTATVSVTSGMNPEVIGMGTTMPSPGMKMMPTPTALEMLDSEPYISSGAKLMKVSGRLKGVVTNDAGEVVGLVVKSGDSMMMSGTTLVRVPRAFRSLAPGYNGTDRVTPLFLNSDIEVVGYPEAPRYGVMSIYENHLSANAIVINRRSVGALGFQKLMLSKKDRRNMMMNNMGGAEKMDMGTMNADEMSASSMGYAPYGTTMMSGSGRMGGDMTTSSTTTTTTSSTTTTTTP